MGTHLHAECFSEDKGMSQFIQGAVYYRSLVVFMEDYFRKWGIFNDQQTIGGQICF